MCTCEASNTTWNCAGQIGGFGLTYFKLSALARQPAPARSGAWAASAADRRARGRRWAAARNTGGATCSARRRVLVGLRSCIGALHTRGANDQRHPRSFERALLVQHHRHHRRAIGGRSRCPNTSRSSSLAPRSSRGASFTSHCDGSSARLKRQSHDTGRPCDTVRCAGGSDTIRPI